MLFRRFNAVTWIAADGSGNDGLLPNAIGNDWPNAAGPDADSALVVRWPRSFGPALAPQRAVTLAMFESGERPAALEAYRR